MKHRYTRYLAALVIVLYVLSAANALAWTDQAHMAMGLAAGFPCFHNCAAADVSHTVAEISGISQTDRRAHFFNAPAGYELAAADACEQLNYIENSGDECPYGYLLGAVLKATRICKEKTAAGVYDDEYYAVLLHYIADMAQPLHLSTYDDFNRSYHFASDHILSDTEAEYPVLAAMALADELTVDDTLCFETEEQLLEAVITLAAQSHELGATMRAEQRNITREEALQQVSRAATLGRAIMRYCGKIR